MAPQITIESELLDQVKSRKTIIRSSSTNDNHASYNDRDRSRRRRHSSHTNRDDNVKVNRRRKSSTSRLGSSTNNNNNGRSQSATERRQRSSSHRRRSDHNTGTSSSRRRSSSYSNKNRLDKDRSNRSGSRDRRDDSRDKTSRRRKSTLRRQHSSSRSKDPPSKPTTNRSSRSKSIPNRSNRQQHYRSKSNSKQQQASSSLSQSTNFRSNSSKNTPTTASTTHCSSTDIPMSSSSRSVGNRSVRSNRSKSRSIDPEGTSYGIIICSEKQWDVAAVKSSPHNDTQPSCVVAEEEDVIHPIDNDGGVSKNATNIQSPTTTTTTTTTPPLNTETAARIEALGSKQSKKDILLSNHNKYHDSLSLTRQRSRRRRRKSSDNAILLEEELLPNDDNEFDEPHPQMNDQSPISSLPPNMTGRTIGDQRSTCYSTVSSISTTDSYIKKQNYIRSIRIQQLNQHRLARLENKKHKLLSMLIGNGNDDDDEEATTSVHIEDDNGSCNFPDSFCCEEEDIEEDVFDEHGRDIKDGMYLEDGIYHAYEEYPAITDDVDDRDSGSRAYSSRRESHHSVRGDTSRRTSRSQRSSRGRRGPTRHDGSRRSSSHHHQSRRARSSRYNDASTVRSSSRRPYPSSSSRYNDCDETHHNSQSPYMPSNNYYGQEEEDDTEEGNNSNASTSIYCAKHPDIVLQEQTEIHEWTCMRYCLDEETGNWCTKKMVCQVCLDEEEDLYRRDRDSSAEHYRHSRSTTRSRRDDFKGYRKEEGRRHLDHEDTNDNESYSLCSDDNDDNDDARSTSSRDYDDNHPVFGASYANLTPLEREAEAQKRRFIRRLAARAYHFPGNTWCEDWLQYMSNTHLVFGIFYHHPLHPVGKRERLVILLGSVAIGLLLTNLIYLWFVHNEFGMDDTVLSFGPNGTLDVTKLMITLWTLGSFVHTCFDLSIWHIKACTLCRLYGHSNYVSDNVVKWGRKIGVVLVLLTLAFATYLALLRASEDYKLDLADEELEDESRFIGPISFDGGAKYFDFMIGYVIEFVLAVFVYSPLILTVVFTGVLGCNGKIPVLGGRPREVLKEQRFAEKRKRYQRMPPTLNLKDDEYLDMIGTNTRVKSWDEIA